jgi:hypothetical protein
VETVNYVREQLLPPWEHVASLSLAWHDPPPAVPLPLRERAVRVHDTSFPVSEEDDDSPVTDPPHPRLYCVAGTASRVL